MEQERAYLYRGNISSAEIFYQKQDNRYSWFEEVKLFGLRLVKEGFYFSNGLYVGGEIKHEKKYATGRKVYWKPYIEFYMVNGDVYQKFFETKQELDRFWQRNSGKNWILLCKN